MRVAVPICTHCWFKYSKGALYNKNSIKADFIPDACKLYGNKSKRLQILPGYFSTYDQSRPVLKRGKPNVLINEDQSFKHVYNTYNASGPFQLINIEWEFIQKSLQFCGFIFCRTKQINDKSSIFPNFIVIYDTNNNSILNAPNWT